MALCSDPLTFTLYSERINGLEIEELIEILHKKIVNPPQTILEFSVELISKVSLDFKRLARIGYSIIKNLMINYKNTYYKEATIEATRLCVLTYSVVEPDLMLL